MAQENKTIINGLKLDKSISIATLVSWVVAMLAAVVAYGYARSEFDHNIRATAENRLQIEAEVAARRLHIEAASAAAAIQAAALAAKLEERKEDINVIKIDIAVMKKDVSSIDRQVTSIERKIDQVILK